MSKNISITVKGCKNLQNKSMEEIDAIFDDVKKAAWTCDRDIYQFTIIESLGVSDD